MILTDNLNNEIEKYNASQAKILQMKETHDVIIATIKMQTGQEIYEKETIKITEITKEHLTEIETLEANFISERNILVRDCENLKATNEQLQMDLVLLREELSREKHNFHEAEADKNERIEFLENDLKNLERTKTNTMIEKEN